MLINSNKFGSLEIPDDKLITMKRPILGFENLTRFCLIEREELAPFLWLQSVDDTMAVFMVVNPSVFYSDYHIKVNPNEISELEVGDVKSVETYVIVTLSEKMGDISVNLQGPILINTENGFAKQLVLVNSRYKVKHRLAELLPDQPATETYEQEPALV